MFGFFVAASGVANKLEWDELKHEYLLFKQQRQQSEYTVIVGSEKRGKLKVK